MFTEPLIRRPPQLLGEAFPRGGRLRLPQPERSDTRRNTVIRGFLAADLFLDLLQNILISQPIPLRDIAGVGFTVGLGADDAEGAFALLDEIGRAHV